MLKQEVLNNLMGFLDYAKQGVDFVKEQAPLYVQELIKYSTVKYTFYTIFSFTGMLLCICSLICGIINLKRCNEDVGFPLFMIGIFGLVVFIIAFCININTYWQVTYAPRVFVIDYILTIVR